MLLPLTLALRTSARSTDLGTDAEAGGDLEEVGDVPHPLVGGRLAGTAVAADELAVPEEFIAGDCGNREAVAEFLGTEGGPFGEGLAEAEERGGRGRCLKGAAAGGIDGFPTDDLDSPAT